MSDREFWITVRAALIMVVRAIEKRYNLSEYKQERNVDDISKG